MGAFQKVCLHPSEQELEMFGVDQVQTVVVDGQNFFGLPLLPGLRGNLLEDLPPKRARHGCALEPGELFPEPSAVHCVRRHPGCAQVYCSSSQPLRVGSCTSWLGVFTLVTLSAL